MRKFRSILLLGLLFFATQAWSKNHKIIILETMPVPAVETHSRKIRTGLDDLAEHNSLILDIEVLKAEGSKTRAFELLRESVRLERPDLVISIGSLASIAAKEVLGGSDVPILFCVVSDPVGTGLVPKISTPSGTNISGLVYSNRLNTKVEMAMRLLARTRYADRVRIGVVSSDYPAPLLDVKNLLEASKYFENIEIVSHKFSFRPGHQGVTEMLADFRKGLDAIREQIDVYWQVTGPLSEIEESAKILVETGIPVINGNTPRSVELGALMAVVVDNESIANEIVAMTEKIFTGVDVATIPVTVPDKFNLYINLDVAKQMNITVPSHLLMIAGKNIFSSSSFAE